MAQYALRYSPSIKRGTKPETLTALAGKGATGGGVGWFGDFDSMAKKTCLRQLLSKYGILSVEMQNALRNDTEETPSTASDSNTRGGLLNAEQVTDIEEEELTQADEQDEEEKQEAPDELKDESGVECEF